MLGRDNNSVFFRQNNLVNKILNTLTWAYEHSPVNFSSITGLYHPSISHVSGNPLLGRAPYIMKDNGLGLNDELNHYAEIAKNDPRGLCYGSLGNLPFLFVTKPSDIQQILLMHDQDIGRSDLLEPFNYIFGNKNLFGMPSNNEWLEKRKALKQWIFVAESLNNVSVPMQEIIDEYINKI